MERRMSHPEPSDEPSAPTRRSKVFARLLIIGLGLLALVQAGGLILSR
jgi:hypothetical protein